MSVVLQTNETLITSQQGIRLAKWIAQCGYCSRREASRLITAGQVTVNGKMANHIDHVLSADTICINGETLAAPGARVTLMYHKPIGIDCNIRAADPASLHHVLATLPQRLFACGRLDKDSFGLLLLTNDGQLSQQLMHPDFLHEKTYQVTTDQPLTQALVQQLASGVSWQLGENIYQSRPCQVEQVAANTFQIILTQGLNRQIRYMCKAVGLRVISLQRIAIGALSLGTLAQGQYQLLTTEQLRLLQQPAFAVQTTT